MRPYFPKIHSFFHKVYRILHNSINDFIKNDDSLKASALTYYTLISIVPFLAVAFGIASGFGFEEYLVNELKHAFEEQSEAINYAIKFALSLLQNTRGSVIAGVGLIALLWTNISMLGSIENALNDIWKVKQPRTWAKKLTDYLAAMIICPIFLVASSSLSLYLITQITQTAKESRWLEFVSPPLLFLLRAAPFFISILLFIVIYLFIPNVRVNTRPRIIAGILAGIAFQLWQWLYIRFQVEISNYNVVYGTFAALPLFLLWLQVSWLIVLAGAELAAHIENEMVYVGPKKKEEVREVSQKLLGLLILYRCILGYNKGEQPLTTMQIAKEYGIPLLTTQQMIDILIEGDILVEVNIRNSSKIGYYPSRDASLFTIKNVSDSIEKLTDQFVSMENFPILDKLTACLEEFNQITEHSQANFNFQKILSEAQ